MEQRDRVCDLGTDLEARHGVIASSEFEFAVPKLLHRGAQPEVGEEVVLAMKFDQRSGCKQVTVDQRRPGHKRHSLGREHRLVL